MLQLPKNVWLLTVAQALILSVNSSVVFIGGLIGQSLSPDPTLSTLPVACLVVGTAVFSVPVTLAMRRFGRRATFLGILLYSIGIALTIMYAIISASFYGFCLSTLLFGATSATAMQFRFAAMESVPKELVPKAASNVLIGGIAAAMIGPEIALLGKNLLQSDFSGSFLLLAIVFFICFLTLIPFRNPVMQVKMSNQKPRSLYEIAKQRVFWIAVLSATVGYAIMTFIMTATPVSMHVLDGHTLQSTKWVIQSHILAMYIPSLVAGWLISSLGVKRMMTIGLLTYLFCIAIAFDSHQLVNYWISLILLGVGWNFLFIGGTTLLPRIYRDSERFKVQAVNEFVIFSTQACASLSAGWIIFTIGWEKMLLITLPIVILQFILITLWSPKATPTVD